MRCQPRTTEQIVSNGVQMAPTESPQSIWRATAVITDDLLSDYVGLPDTATSTKHFDITETTKRLNNRLGSGCHFGQLLVEWVCVTGDP